MTCMAWPSMDLSPRKLTVSVDQTVQQAVHCMCILYLAIEQPVIKVSA